MEKIQLECIVFRKNGDKYEFLLLKRTPSMGGFWQPPCGKMEERDKDLMDGCLREIYEETSIKKENIIRIIEGVHYFEMDKHYLTGEKIPTIKEFVSAYEVGLDTRVDMKENQDKEHDEFRWVNYDEAIQMLKWENNKEAFKSLHKILNK